MPKQLNRNERQYQIYALIDPRDNTIRYIGKSDDVKYRYYQHLHSIGGGRQERQWIRELKILELVPALRILETIDKNPNAHKLVLVRERYWIDNLISTGHPLINVFGVTLAYPQIDKRPPKISSTLSTYTPPAPRSSKPKPSWLGLFIVSTDIHDFSKLIENMPANLSELARLSNVSERSIMRMRDGESVLRGTANKVLRGLSQIYGETFNLDNVTGINLYDR